MLHYTKILLSFILSIVMDKNDYNFFHKEFKPIRVIVFFVLILNVPFTIYLLDSFHDHVVKMETYCPNLVVKKPTVFLTTEKKEK